MWLRRDPLAASPKWCHLPDHKCFCSKPLPDESWARWRWCRRCTEKGRDKPSRTACIGGSPSSDYESQNYRESALTLAAGTGSWMVVFQTPELSKTPVRLWICRWRFSRSFPWVTGQHNRCIQLLRLAGSATHTWRRVDHERHSCSWAPPSLPLSRLPCPCISTRTL